MNHRSKISLNLSMPSIAFDFLFQKKIWRQNTRKLYEKKI